MADFDTNEADAAPQPINVDDDLIDYDSDVSVKDVQTKQAAEPGDMHASVLDVASSERDPADPDASDPAETPKAAGSVSASDISHEDHSDADADADKDVDSIANDGSNPFINADNDVSLDNLDEIDYDHEGLTFDAITADEGDNLSAPVLEERFSVHESPLPANAETENETGQYEIDWEEDEAANSNPSPSAAAKEAPQRGPMDINDVDFAAGNDAQGNAAEGVDPADQDESTQGPTTSQVATESDAFPNITVGYKGQSYPMFAHGPDGFFTNGSLVDETMKTVLEAFRAELEVHNDLGPHDELIFQVDKLGLEFCESSPPETLAMTNLRQLLEILDILVKNEDFESSRTLTTYLFTKPNAMKRFEFLVESATDKNESLEDVIYYFKPPFDVSEYDETNALTGYDEQLGDVEGAGIDIASNGGDEYADDHESIEDEEAAYEYDEDGLAARYEDDGAERDASVAAYGADDESAATNDNGEPVEIFHGNGDEAVANEEEDLIDYADAVNASNDGQDHVEVAASAGTETMSNHNEEELMDYSEDKITDDYTQASPRKQSVNDDEDVVDDYTDDRNAGNDEDDAAGRQSGGAGDKSTGGPAQELPLAGSDDHEKDIMPRDANTEVDANHVEDDVGLVDHESNEYSHTADSNNAVSYDAGGGEVIEHSGEPTRQESTAQTTATQAGVADNATNSTDQHQNGSLQVGARHTRNPSDVSITFSAPDADGALPAHAPSANDTLLGLGVDESTSFDHAYSEGTHTSAGQYSAEGEGDMSTAGATGAGTLATLGNEDDAALLLNPLVGEDELSEIDWTEDPVPVVADVVEDVQGNAMKRPHPHETDVQDGNDVKRRRS